MRHYLVTGGGGFIGSALSKNLLEKGNKITIFDNFQRGMLSRIESIKEQVNIVNGDIRNLTDVLKAMQNVDTVYHLAAVNGTENFYYHSKLVLDVGIKGILNINGKNRPAVIHGVQHIFYPLEWLEKWPGNDKKSRLVFITKNMNKKNIDELFKIIGENELNKN